MSEQAYTLRKCTAHDPYWETVYGNCMACRAEKAERDLAAIQATVGDTEFALRARVAEVEQERDEAVKAKLMAYQEVESFMLKLAAMTRERDDVLRERFGVGLWVRAETLAASQARCREMEAELIKWQQPFDADMLKEVEQQTSHWDSLAAQRVYITALEHGLKQLQATLASYDATLERVSKLEASIREVCGVELNALSNMGVGFIEKAVKWYQATLAAREAEVRTLHKQFEVIEQQRDNWKRTALGLRDDLQASLNGVRVEYGELADRQGGQL